MALKWLVTVALLAVMSVSAFAEGDQDTIVNEVAAPQESAWRAIQAGATLEAQVTIGVDKISADWRHMPIVIWMRNVSDGLVTINVVKTRSGRFVPHGDLVINGPDGRDHVRFRCMMQHEFARITFAPGEVKGFMCDALHLPCSERSNEPLAPGPYYISFREGKAARVIVE